MMSKRTNQAEVHSMTSDTVHGGAVESSEAVGAGTIEIIADGFDEQAQLLFKRLRAADRTLTIAGADVVQSPRQLFVRLANAGICLATAKSQKALLEKFETTKCEVTFSVFSQLGWQQCCGHLVFVGPNYVAGMPGGRPYEIVLPFRRDLLDKFRDVGSLEDWKTRVAQPCDKNSRLICAVTTALAGPFLHFMPKAAIRTGGIQFVGPRETGKTSALMGAGSIFGCHLGDRAAKGFAELWNATGNEAEAMAKAHTQHAYVIDESSVIEPKLFLDALFRLSEGVEKARKDQDTVGGWSGFIISSSNYTISDLSRQIGKTPNEALLSRVFDIPLPANGHGIFENLGGFESGHHLSRHLQEAAQTTFGTAGKAAVDRIVVEIRSGRERKLRRRLRKRRDEYLVAARRAAEQRGIKLWLARPADRFASAYASGAAAAQYGILPWSAECQLAAIISCHLDGLQQLERDLESSDRKGASRPAIDPLTQLTAYVNNHKAEFREIGGGLRSSHPFGSRPGYTASFKKKNWIYFEATQFRKIVGGQSAAATLMKTLVAQGLAASSASAMTVQRPFYRGREGNKGYMRVVAIRAKLFRRP